MRPTIKNKKLMATIDDYNKTSAINSMKLVRLVRKHELLYNNLADGYNDKNQKEFIWERINQALFPKYNSLDIRIKEVVRTNVRRRWKTLRNSISREIKKASTLENYCRKKESPIMSELEFLIPHIKSVHCEKFSKEMESRNENYEDNYLNDDDAIEDEDPDENAIDLTDDIDMKPIFKLDTSLSIGSPEIHVDNMPTEALYPSVQINGNNITTDHATELQQHTATTQSNKVVTHNSTPIWNNNEYCSLAEYREGEFTNSTVLCTEQDNDEDTNSPVVSTSTNNDGCKQLATSLNDFMKRDKSNLEDPAELQAKILQLLSNLERRERTDIRLEQESHDEDRMFLLSMVSDLKRVPSAKKMLVKAEITTAIARAIQ